MVGSALIGRLWLVALDAVSLGDAARGLIYLLLALGLVGHQRLSLALTAMVCSLAFLSGPTNGMGSSVVAGEYLLFTICLLLFCIHPRHPRTEEA